MNRKTFLATICALFTTPFIGKSNATPAETTITEQDLIDLVDSVSPKYQIGGYYAGWRQGVIKGEDLVYIHEKESYRRGRNANP